MKKNKNITRYKRNVSRYKRNVSNTKVDIKKQAKQVNRMIRALKKKHTNIRDLSYAVEKLVGKLEHIESINESKLIDKRSNMIQIKNIVELKPVSARAFVKALQDFKKSETSTNRGLARVAKRLRKQLMQKTHNEAFVNSLSDKEITNFYKIFEDENYEKATMGVDSETAYTLITDVVKYDLTEEQFANSLEQYANSYADMDVRRSMSAIYKKYLNMRK